jgi:serine protease AprX
VLSTVAGFQQDSLIGAAPFASFLLAKTEDLPTETRLEEENYAAAVEWAESRGADIISSSLGYSRMDNTDESYTYDDMNGSLPIVSRAVNDAVKRGVFVYYCRR